MRTRFARAVVCAIVAATLLAGCTPGSSGQSEVADHDNGGASRVALADLNVLADPKSYVGESTAVLSDASIDPMARPAQSLPVTVTSHDLSGDTQVTVTDASRIIPMDISGSIAATVFKLGLGDDVVGRDISTTFAEAASLPVVTGSAHTINAESVLALSPTLVITDGSIGPIDVVEQLRDTGVTVVFVNTETTSAGPAELAREVAAALGVSAAGETLANNLNAQIQDVVSQIARIAPSDPSKKLRIMFLYLRGSSGIYYLFGAGSGADVLIDALGGIDVAAEIGWVGEKPMTAEAITAAQPDLILVMTSGLASVGGVDGLLAARPEIALTPAGAHRRFVSMDDGQILSFGPRYPAVLDALARAIYAPDSP